MVHTLPYAPFSAFQTSYTHTAICAFCSFMAQSVLRLEAEAGVKFEPGKVNLDQATNVLDRWIAAASRNLTAYVRQVRVTPVQQGQVLAGCLCRHGCLAKQRVALPYVLQLLTTSL